LNISFLRDGGESKGLKNIAGTLIRHPRPKSKVS
jgi:hypothetical protein